MRKTEIAKKLEEFKKEVAKKEREEKKQTKKYQQRRQQKSKSRKRRSPRGLEGDHKTPKNTRQFKIVDLGDWKFKHVLIN